MDEVWFKYVVDNTQLWPPGFTAIRLEKIKDAVLSDEHIMEDLLERHNAQSIHPEYMKLKDKELFNHCLSNFVLNILNKMRKEGMVKL